MIPYTFKILIVFNLGFALGVVQTLLWNIILLLMRYFREVYKNKEKAF